MRDSGWQLTAVYSDADYADESNDGRSASVTVVTLGGAAISRASSTQRCATFSATEAGYVAQ